MATKKINNLELEEIDPARSLFESKRNREGDWCLFFRKEEVDELLGHQVKFYPNGVLLVLKDNAKDFSKNTDPTLKYESKSFAFYNNENVENIILKRPVFEIHNRNRNHETRVCEKPIKDIEVKVLEHYLYVKEIDETVKEYFVDILTGEKTYLIQEEQQIGIDF